MTKPKFCIINEFDKPTPRHIAQLVGETYTYMDKSLSHFNKINPERPTNIEDFGFLIIEDEIQKNVTFKKIAESKATYKNGEIRDWQHPDEEFTLNLVKMKDKK